MKLVILDRDGVINEDSDDYIKSVAEWHPVPGSLEAIARLCQAGYRVFVASNQSGIGRGLFDYRALFDIHEHLQHALQALGGRVEAIAFAPAHPGEDSPKRKPAPGMLVDLAQRLQVDLGDVPFVGDSWSDVEAARAAGARPVLVRSGKGGRTIMKHDISGIDCFDNLAAFVNSELDRAAAEAAEARLRSG